MAGEPCPVTHNSPRTRHGQLSVLKEHVGTLKASGRVVELSWPRQSAPSVGGGLRGCITAWSPASRRRLLYRAGCLAWEEARRAWGGSWLFVTLTYRDDPGPEKAHRDLDVLGKKWARKYGRWSCLWKLEFQRRGVPHFHLLVWSPATDAADLASVRKWSWEAWRDVVAAGRKLRVDVDYSRDRDMARYFTFYAGRKDKAYQHVVPATWASTGRWWGVAGIPDAWCWVDLGRADYVVARRTLRRYRRATSRRRPAPWGAMERRWVLGRAGEGVLAQQLLEWINRAHAERLSPPAD